MRFHLDENVTAAVGRGLRERGLDVPTTPASRLLSAADPAQFAFAIRERRVLVSHDTDVLRLAAEALAAGENFAGVAYCDKQKYPTGRLIERLLKLAASVTDDEMQNRVEFL